MNNIDNIIEKYVQGDLSLAEVKNFEQYLSRNPDIQQQVDIQKDTIESIKQKARLQMKARLSQINPKAGASLTQKIAIAAATFVTVTLIGIGTYSTSIDPKPIAENVKTTNSINKTNKAAEVTKGTPVETEVKTVPSTSNFAPKTTVKSTLETKKTNVAVSRNKAKNKITTPVKENSDVVNTSNFDPLKEIVNHSDDNIFSGNDAIAIDPSNAQGATSKTPTPYKIENNKEQGYIYDGTSIGISGKYKSTYTVSKELGMLIFEYDNKFYKIMVSNQLEKWKNHEITDPTVVKRLTDLKTQRITKELQK